MKWIKKQDLNESTLREGKIIALMLNRNGTKLVTREENLHKQTYSCNEELPRWLKNDRKLLHNQKFVVQHEDGSLDVWTLSRAHFINLLALMYESDMVKELHVQE